MFKIHGGIFGVFQGNNHIFIMISLVILISLFIYAYKTSKENKFKFILWQFIIAGGLSNIIDRIFRGFVIDFIAMKPFGIFNIADVCIVISVILMVFIEIKEIASERNKSTNN